MGYVSCNIDHNNPISHRNIYKSNMRYLQTKKMQHQWGGNHPYRNIITYRSMKHLN